MRVLAVVLLCAFAAVQGRSASVSNSKALASLGEYPWALHFRIAESTSGFLSSCAGSLISERWALSAAECFTNARFIWIRYGVINVINPELVTEASISHSSADNKLAIVAINRDVETTANIAPVSLVSANAVLERGTYCRFSGEEANAPGDYLQCSDVSVQPSEDGKLIAGDTFFNRFDLGASLVSEGVQIGVLVDINEDNSGIFAPTADYLEWIEGVTGLSLAPEDNEDSLRVKVIN